MKSHPARSRRRQAGGQEGRRAGGEEVVRNFGGRIVTPALQSSEMLVLEQKNMAAT